MSNINNSSPITKSFVSSQQTITSAGTLTIPHGLGIRPSFITFEIVCQTAELSYTVGQVVPMYICSGSTLGSAVGAGVVLDATNITLRFSANVSVFNAPDFATGLNAAFTNANWKLVVRAFA